MPETSQTILDRFRRSYGREIDLTLRPAYRDLLKDLGEPQKNLPPVFHVAGTNGKGSTCAFLRAMLEADGYKVHVYTSPHLVSFYERIRIAGKLIDENELAQILAECERLAAPGGVTYFEVITAAALAAFARHRADFTILEVGFGGRLDATNVVEKPLATLISRLSFDHRDYLGERMDQIAREKAGIMRAGVPCFTIAQPNADARAALCDAAEKTGAILHVGGADWQVAARQDGFSFRDATRDWALPLPALLGAHQVENAGLAIAALGVLPQALPRAAIEAGLRQVEWPARLQKLETGALAALLPPSCDLWLDGGHNDSAGEVLAAQITRWRAEDDRPLFIVMGMLTSKNPAEFTSPFAAAVRGWHTVPVEEALGLTAEDLAQELKKTGIAAQPMPGVAAALRDLAPRAAGGRVLICGSLYLAGSVLKENN